MIFINKVLVITGLMGHVGNFGKTAKPPSSFTVVLVDHSEAMQQQQGSAK
ncbi:hypothetical protein [Motilimonas eburnea]|nr:hypothetical protein [Motilimonas eburnea]MCE2571106.1 hypothetical protein [Motilimonas eburnea]